MASISGQEYMRGVQLMLFNNIIRGVARLCPVAIITFLLAGILTARTQASPVQPIYDNEQQRPPNIVLILFDWARRDSLLIRVAGVVFL